MKIKKLNTEQKKIFKNEFTKYLSFLNDNIERLSVASKNLYGRTLAFISTINELQLKTPLETCIILTQKILSDENLISIFGEDNTSENNKNIQISAFKNLVEVYKQEIKKDISPTAYKELMKVLGQKGNMIRQKIQEKRAEKEVLNICTLKTWEEFQNILIEYNKKFKYIQQQFLITNEIPDYHFLRDCLVCNLYLNNTYKIKQTEFNVILRNEYKNLFLHIGDEPPILTNKNYFWIKLDSTDHKIIINKNKTTGGIKRVLGSEIGLTSVKAQKNQKIYPLNKNIAKIILFIKQVFNERPDKPFIKCNNRELNYNSSTWGKMLNRVFKKLGNNITCNVIRKVYDQYIDWDNINSTDKSIIMSMNDFNKPKNYFNNPKLQDKITRQEKENHLKKMIQILDKNNNLTPESFLKTVELEFL